MNQYHHTRTPQHTHLQFPQAALQGVALRRVGFVEFVGVTGQAEVLCVGPVEEDSRVGVSLDQIGYHDNSKDDTWVRK